MRAVLGTVSAASLLCLQSAHLVGAIPVVQQGQILLSAGGEIATRQQLQKPLVQAVAKERPLHGRFLHISGT